MDNFHIHNFRVSLKEGEYLGERKIERDGGREDEREGKGGRSEDVVHDKRLFRRPQYRTRRLFSKSKKKSLYRQNC